MGNDHPRRWSSLVRPSARTPLALEGLGGWAKHRVVGDKVARLDRATRALSPLRAFSASQGAKGPAARAGRWTRDRGKYNAESIIARMRLRAALVQSAIGAHEPNLEACGVGLFLFPIINGDELY